MEIFLTLGLTIFLAVVTPGPNNFMVMALASEGGFRAAVPALIGVVLGTEVLAILLLMGAGPIFDLWPFLVPASALAGGLFLLWMAFRLWSSDDGIAAARIIHGFWGLFVFQLVNPKSWAMVTAVSALALAQMAQPARVLILLFLVIPGMSLCLWAMGGRVISTFLTGRARQPVLRGMATALAVTAGFLVWNGVF